MYPERLMLEAERRIIELVPDPGQILGHDHILGDTKFKLHRKLVEPPADRARVRCCGQLQNRERIPEGVRQAALAIERASTQPVTPLDRRI